MGNLADNVRKAALQKSSENLPQGDNTAKLQTALATGATGKGQDTGQGLRQSNVAEQLGLVKAREQQQAVVVSGLDAASEIAHKEAQRELDNNKVESANRIQEENIEAEKADKVDELLSTIQFEDTKLEHRRDVAAIEKAARDLRLQSQEYRHDLEMAGQYSRLHDRKERTLEVNRLVLGERTSLFTKELEHKGVLAENKRDRQWDASTMGLDDAINLAISTIEDQSNAQIVGGVRDVAISGAAAYGSGAFDGETPGPSLQDPKTGDLIT